ncbi:MAG: hypothetical protein E7461_05510 [Ruminococcaceae bacterium]|nr:hypothetical protein [Oscillospiraceae bacterium]
MTQTSLLFSRFLIACLLGGGLGIFYDLLTVFPRCLRHLTDGIFVLALFACGLYLGFQICEGDLRLSYSAGLFAGFLLWHNTLGSLLRRVISRISRFLGGIFSQIWMICKKTAKNISVFCKKTFAIVKK